MNKTIRFKKVLETVAKEDLEVFMRANNLLPT
jgi:hypothetical protein